MSAPICLRDCPCCHKPSHHDGESGPILTVENMIDLSTGEEVVDIGYSVRCVDCGLSVTNEYLEEAVRLWNGEPEKQDEEDVDGTLVC